MTTINELLQAARVPYVRVLAEAVRAQSAHVEPAFRREDGSLSLEGLLRVPCRADYIPKEGGAAGVSCSVDSSTQLQFEPVSFSLGNTSVVILPLVWDWIQVEVAGPGLETCTRVFRTWFMRWFDPEDCNEATPEGLYGVVHFISDPEPAENAVIVNADLGSSSVEVLEDLLFSLADAGAVTIRLG